ncbi:Ubiquinone biosynthesis O-methyltransferase, mitochondrial [Firmicutes bacterium ASF500]|nr:Ubiquinone biosynthesis O-methyltransferase, mitochondrial [Firmicutes bacterium ASF500]
MQNNLSENLSKWDEISAYSQWMFSLYEQYIGKRVVDIGCGIGTMTAYYIDGRELVVGVDIFQNQIDLLNKRFREKGNFKGILLDIMSEDTEELKKYKFDTVVCINTLEHLENDELAILKMGDVISAGGGTLLY